MKKGSDSLLLSASEEEIDRALELIESMKEDLMKVMNMPLNDDVAEDFRAHESLTLKEIEEFYSKFNKNGKK
ncbi:hypothetical protein [Mycoplasma parvum]|uniref:hypothetical protein n=1 Tax=Mycoplasma parvum TaxID=984991 RepID=UPI001F3B4CF8|nr:hypothetical protein [Mycoplasma parvum]